MDITPDRTTFLEMIKSLRDLGHDVVLVTGCYSKREKYGLGEKLVHLPTIRQPYFNQASFFLFGVISFWHQLLTFRPDVVVLDPYTFFIAFPIDLISKLGFLHIKFILDIRSYTFFDGLIKKSVKNKLSEFLFNISLLYSSKVFSGITVISPLMKSQISKRYGFSEDRVGQWSSGVNIESFNPDLPGLHERIPQFNDRFIIMYHGTLSASRRLDLVIKALPLVIHEIPELLLCIMGQGPLEAELKRLVSELKLRNNVHFEPAHVLNEVPKFVFSCNFGILPYPLLNYWETSSPIKFFEYLAMNKPVIATNLAAFRDVINAMQVCVFIQELNPEGIAGAISNAYEEFQANPELGRGGREVASRFTWRNQALAFVNFVETFNG